MLRTVTAAIVLSITASVAAFAHTPTKVYGQGRASSIQTATGLALIDATGVKIGIAYTPQAVGYGTNAVLDLEGALVTVPLERYRQGDLQDAERLQFPRRVSAWYASADCSGAPLIAGIPPSTGTRPVAMVFDGTDMLLYIAETGLSSPQAVQSYFADARCTPNPAIVNAWSVKTVVNLTSRFREPLRIVLDK